jgi:hypothetical protein
MKQVPYIFYNNSQKDAQGRNTGFFGFNKGDELTLAYAGTLEVDDNASNSRVCNKLFDMFNAEERPAADYRGPSMSVGDVLLINHELAYSVESFGFKDMATSTLNASPLKMHPAKWIS